MSGITSSILPGHQRQDIEQLTFAERVQLGAENAVRCMGVTANDRIFIMTDYERESIARHVAMAALDHHADVSVRFLEHYGERPLTTFSDELRNDLIQARPTVT
jgi:aminopeptidase